MQTGVLTSWLAQDGEQVEQGQPLYTLEIEKSVTEGPQIVTKRGVETAVLVPIDEWQRARPTLKELLLAPEPRFEGGLPYPKRGGLRRRKPMAFE